MGYRHRRTYHKEWGECLRNNQLIDKSKQTTFFWIIKPPTKEKGWIRDSEEICLVYGRVYKKRGKHKWGWKGDGHTFATSRKRTLSSSFQEEKLWSHEFYRPARLIRWLNLSPNKWNENVQVARTRSNQVCEEYHKGMKLLVVEVT